MYKFVTLLLCLSLQAHADLNSEIRAAATRHKLNPMLMQAIREVETGQVKGPVLRRNTNSTYDAGPFQINSVHWTTTCKHLNILTDAGNVECAALLLASFKHRFAHRDPIWWARYHSKTPRLKQNYANKVKVILQNADKLVTNN